MAIGGHGGPLQLQCSLAATKRLFERDLDARMVVAPGPGRTRAAAGKRTRAAEQVGEEVAELGITARGLPRVLEVAAPVGWRLKLLAGRAAPQLVIRDAFFRITEHLVGLLQLLEFVFRIRFLADVRVVLASQLPIGPLDFRLRRATLEAHHLVIVAVLHRPILPSPPPPHANSGGWPVKGVEST